MSLCHDRNPDFEDIEKMPNKIPDNELSIGQEEQTQSRGSMRRTKKNKTRMPKDNIFKEEDEMLLSQYKGKDSSLEFDDFKDEKKDTSNNVKDSNINNIINNDEKKKKQK